MVADTIGDLLPGYALGTLDEDELIQVARHLPDCAQCRQELVLLWQAGDQLALALPLRTPPPELRARILARVEQGSAPQQGVLTEAVRARPLPLLSLRVRLGAMLARLFTPRLRLAFGGLALALMLVLAASSIVMWQRIQALQALLPAGNIRLVDMHGTSNAPQARGYLMVFQNETYGTLVVEDAPALDLGYQYQLWLIRDGERTSGGVFFVDEQGYGTLEISTPLPIETYPSFGVTVEPLGGSPSPTGAKMLGGDL